VTNVLIAVLTAAVLHAGWNALAKADGDRFGLFAKASVASVGIGAVLAVVIALPARAAWPWLIASALVHTLYNIGLLAAYQVGDFNQTYPLARGIGPLVVALVATFALGEPLPAIPAAGVVIIAAGIGVLGLTPWQRVRHNRAALTAAVLTGLTIAAYTLLDGIGVRRSGSPIGYTAWLLAIHGVTTVVAVALIRRSRWAPAAPDKPARWWIAGVIGAMSMLAYGLVLWAQTHGALAAIAALRESSVVVAAFLGAALFREPLGRVRIAASMAVAAGVVMLALA
jgi:drug/metabolite transporter (DMT)-like permease